MRERYRRPERNSVGAIQINSAGVRDVPRNADCSGRRRDQHSPGEGGSDLRHRAESDRLFRRESQKGSERSWQLDRDIEW